MTNKYLEKIAGNLGMAAVGAGIGAVTGGKDNRVGGALLGAAGGVAGSRILARTGGKIATKIGLGEIGRAGMSHNQAVSHITKRIGQGVSAGSAIGMVGGATAASRLSAKK